MQEDQRCAAKGVGLAAAEPRPLSLLSTHLSFTQIAQELFLCAAPVKPEGELDLPEARSLFAGQALAGRGPRPPGKVTIGFSCHLGDGTRPETR
jgi:hypothetical protein